jgi:hypothetical protein
MSGIFGGDEPRPTAPSAAQQRADQLAATERERSERDRVSTIQDQLRLETSSRSRGYGLTSLFSSLSSSRRSLLGSG